MKLDHVTNIKLFYRKI